MDGWSEIASALEDGKKEFERQELIHKIDQIKAQFESGTLIRVEASFQHLLDGLNSEIEQVKRDEFLMARQGFAGLVALDPDGTTGGIPNRELIGLGHLGNFHYFNLVGDKRNALLQVYECTQRFPLIGLCRFPPRFFSRDYFVAASQLLTELAALKAKYIEVSGKNFRSSLAGYTANSLKAATGILVGFFAGAVVGTITGGTGAGPAAVASFGGTVSALGGLKSPAKEDTSSLEGSIEGVAKNLISLLQDLDKECRERLETLAQHTLQELLGSRLGASATGLLELGPAPPDVI